MDRQKVWVLTWYDDSESDTMLDTFSNGDAAAAAYVALRDSGINAEDIDLYHTTVYDQFVDPLAENS